MTAAAPTALSRRSMIAIIVLGLLILATLGFALYGRGGAAGNQASATCGDSGTILAKLTPALTGDLAAMRPLTHPKPLPAFGFTDASGPVSLDKFKGKTVLLNVWATWCVPCREEMPALDHVESSLGGADFTVLALNMDTRNTERVPDWLKQNGIDHLALYRDSDGKAFQVLRKEGLVTGLPTTMLVDKQGCLVAMMAGPAKWDSQEALKALALAITP
jgi:thiol-disulfide isomerase/thioredoxin